REGAFQEPSRRPCRLDRDPDPPDPGRSRLPRPPPVDRRSLPRGRSVPDEREGPEGPLDARGPPAFEQQAHDQGLVADRLEGWIEPEPALHHPAPHEHGAREDEEVRGEHEAPPRPPSPPAGDPRSVRPDEERVAEDEIDPGVPIEEGSHVG